MVEIKIKVSNRQLKSLHFAVGMYLDMAKGTLKKMNENPRDFAISTMSIEEQKKEQEKYIADLRSVFRKIGTQEKKFSQKENK